MRIASSPDVIDPNRVDNPLRGCQVPSSFIRPFFDRATSPGFNWLGRRRAFIRRKKVSPSVTNGSSSWPYDRYLDIYLFLSDLLKNLNAHKDDGRHARHDAHNLIDCAKPKGGGGSRHSCHAHPVHYPHESSSIKTAIIATNMVIILPRLDRA